MNPTQKFTLEQVRQTVRVAITDLIQEDRIFEDDPPVFFGQNTISDLEGIDPKELSNAVTGKLAIKGEFELTTDMTVDKVTDMAVQKLREQRRLLEHRRAPAGSVSEVRGGFGL